MPYSGQFADTATQMDNGIKLYVKQHGDTVAGRKIELIRKDTGGVAPDVAKRLAQELVVRDKVDILAGFVLTPNALAAGDVSAEAKKFMVVMNAATSIITTKSPYMVRTSVTIPQLNETFGTWAYQERRAEGLHHGVRLRPRPRRRAGVPARLQGRRRRDRRRRCASRWRTRISRPSCSAPRTSAPEAIFIFIPGGAQPAALGKALAERGIDPKKTKIIGMGELTEDEARKSDGRRVARHHHRLPLRPQPRLGAEQGVRQGVQRGATAGATRTSISIGGYDGMHLIYEALKKTGGKTDAEALIAAAKGMAWESPRGPVSIDPETRDIVQTVYIRARGEGRRRSCSTSSSTRSRTSRTRSRPG